MAVLTAPSPAYHPTLAGHPGPMARTSCTVPRATPRFSTLIGLRVSCTSCAICPDYLRYGARPSRPMPTHFCSPESSTPRAISPSSKATDRQVAAMAAASFLREPLLVLRFPLETKYVGAPACDSAADSRNFGRLPGVNYLSTT